MAKRLQIVVIVAATISNALDMVNLAACSKPPGFQAVLA